MSKLLKICAAGTIGLTTVVLVFLAYLQISGNFHEVVPGQVFRAGQMDGQKLARWKREHGIASVLNLRGQNDGEDWYETERAVTDRLAIQHIDFRMSANTELTDNEVQSLLEVMREAPKPMLIHCKAGSDRTGIASALYIAGIEGLDEDQAEWHLSLAYGHVSLPWISNAWSMDVTWERIEPWLGFPDS